MSRPIPSPGPSTLGERLGTIDAAGFLVTETRHQPRLAIPEHVHEHACLTVVVAGGLVETYSDRELVALPWSLVVRPAGREHSNRFDEAGCHSLVVDVSPERRQSLGGLSGLLDDPLVISGAGVSGATKRLYAEFKSGDAFAALALEGLLLELWARALRQTRNGSSRASEPHWLVRARGVMRDRFAENIGLSEVASCVGVHPVHLARTFREHHGTTVGEHIRKLRIDYAAERLAATPMPLAEIAERAGFADQSHFCRLFRRHTGMTPSQFRKAR